MKMLTEDQLRELMGKAYMRGRTDQRKLEAEGPFYSDCEEGSFLHSQMDAETSQVERIIAGL